MCILHAWHWYMHHYWWELDVFNTMALPSQSGIPKFVQGTGLEVVDYVSVGTISTKVLISLHIAYYYGCFVVGLTLAYTIQ